MAITETGYRHIVLEDGEPAMARIAGTTMKVVELVTAQRAYAWSPEELAFQFPHLTLGQIHSALAYYWDHQDELDREIARRSALADEIERRTPPAAVLTRLRGHRSG